MEKQHGTDSTSETGKSNENQLKKFETNNIGTSTENILTHSMETLTEVINIIYILYKFLFNKFCFLG